MCVSSVYRGPYLEQRGREGLKQEWFTKYFSFWAQTHKKHTCSSCKYISPYTVHCFLYTSVCLTHTHIDTHTQKYGLITSNAISNIASKLNQKVLLEHMPDLFSNIGLPDLVCIVWNVSISFFKSGLPFLKMHRLLESHDMNIPGQCTFLEINNQVSLWVWKHSTYSTKILIKTNTHTRLTIPKWSLF